MFNATDLAVSAARNALSVAKRGRIRVGKTQRDRENDQARKNATNKALNGQYSRLCQTGNGYEMKIPSREGLRNNGKKAY